VVGYYLIWMMCRDLVVSGKANFELLWAPPLIVAAWGVVRLWMINNESLSLGRRWRIMLRRA